MFSNSEFRLAHCTAPFTVSACKQPSYRPLLRLEQLRGRSPPPTGWRRSHSEAWGLWRSCGTCHGNWDRETIRWVYRISRISICPTSFFTFSPNCLVIQLSKRNSLHPVAWLSFFQYRKCGRTALRSFEALERKVSLPPPQWISLCVTAEYWCFVTWLFEKYI